jgi:hypothetical protein
MNYKTQLKTYSKAQFDPFRRDEKRRIIFNYDANDPEKSIETTVGQLNFFKWAIETGVMDYVFQHKTDLEAEMRSNSTPGQVVQGLGTSAPTSKDEVGTDSTESSSNGTDLLQSKSNRSVRNEVLKIKTLDRTTVITFD